MEHSIDIDNSLSGDYSTGCVTTAPVKTKTYRSVSFSSDVRDLNDMLLYLVDDPDEHTLEECILIERAQSGVERYDSLDAHIASECYLIDLYRIYTSIRKYCEGYSWKNMFDLCDVITITSIISSFPIGEWSRVFCRKDISFDDARRLRDVGHLSAEQCEIFIISTKMRMQRTFREDWLKRANDTKKRA